MIYKRKNCVAGQFYPSGPKACERELAGYTAFDTDKIPFSGPARAGIVPHAGWVFSGATAGKVFAFIARHAKPKVFIVFGAAHRMRSGPPAVMAEGAWETPLGPVNIDVDVASELISFAGCPVSDDPSYHDDEHSIEVQMPFIKYLFPDAAFVPAIVPPGGGAEALGAAAGRIIASRPAGEIVAIGSTDLTHYGYEYGFSPHGMGDDALRWVRDVNDRSFIDAATALDAARVISDARKLQNACGPGAAAATVAAAKEAGATSGTLLEYTTSHDVMPRGAPSMFVGYAGIVF